MSDDMVIERSLAGLMSDDMVIERSRATRFGKEQRRQLTVVVSKMAKDINAAHVQRYLTYVVSRRRKSCGFPGVDSAGLQPQSIWPSV
jgi:hypothetical protein